MNKIKEDNFKEFEQTIACLRAEYKSCGLKSTKKKERFLTYNELWLNLFSFANHNLKVFY